MTLPSSRHRIRNSNPEGRRRARYLTVTEAPHNTELYGEETAGTGKRTPNSSVKGSGANHYPRAPPSVQRQRWAQCLLTCKRRPSF